MTIPRALRAGLALLVLTARAAIADPAYVRIEGGAFTSVIPAGERGSSAIVVPPFALRARPVTNGEFLAFVTAHPEWRRGAAPAVFADSGYLRHWQGPLTLGPADRDAPVTRISWFAAGAYCDSEGARLPTWAEWELAAAASERERDARSDPAWRQRILDWYARPSHGPLPHVGEQPPNVYGVHDLHGVIWEWVGDFNSLLVSGDDRERGDPDRTRFCGSGALSLTDKENYAVLMRIAMLSSLEAAYTTENLGFRCARLVEAAR